MCFVNGLGSYHCVQRVGYLRDVIVASRTKSKDPSERGGSRCYMRISSRTRFNFYRFERKVEDGRRASESRILSMELRFFPRHDSRKNFPATFRLPRQKQREGKQYEALCYERCNWTKCVKTFNELTA